MDPVLICTGEVFTRCHRLDLPGSYERHINTTQVSEVDTAVTWLSFTVG